LGALSACATKPSRKRASVIASIAGNGRCHVPEFGCVVLRGHNNSCSCCCRL
jgi:hypothetical protein